MSRSRVSYTGHARGGKFQGLNLTRAGIEANKRKAADDLQILREQSIQREAVEKENLRQMQAAFSAEQTQAAENRQFEQGLESKRMEFLRRNQRTEEKAGAQRVQNILLESQDKAKDLSVFSKGAMQLFETGQKMYTEHQETAELISGVLGDTNFEDLRNEHLAEAELNILSTRRQNMLALMLESGIARDDPRFVAEEARKDRSTDFKLVKEHVTTLGAKYSGWMQQKLGELGLVDPGQISRAKGILAYQFLVEHNLVNEKGGVINKSILRPLFQSMEAAYNSEIKQASFAELRVALDDNANKKLTLYYKDQSEENLAHVLAAFRTKLGKDGEPLGQGATSHFFRTVLTNTLEITDTELEQFLDSKVPESWAQKPGQTFRDRYQKDGINSPLLQEVMEGRKEDIAARNRRDKGVESAVHAGKLKAAMDWVQGINPDDMWDKDIDDLKLVISELKKEGIDTNTLEQYLLNSNESQNAAWWTEYLKGLETKGVLTQDDLKDTNIPITVRREFAKSAKTLSDQLQEAGVGKLSDLDKDWEDYLKIQMKAENAFSVTDGSLREGVREAGRQYAAKFKRYAKTLPIFDAHRKAYTEIQSDLENGVGKFKVENNRATGVAELPAFKSKAYLNSTKYNPDDLDDNTGSLGTGADSKRLATLKVGDDFFKDSSIIEDSTHPPDTDPAKSPFSLTIILLPT